MRILNGYYVQDPERYRVAEFDESGKIPAVWECVVKVCKFDLIATCVRSISIGDSESKNIRMIFANGCLFKKCQKTISCNLIISFFR